MNTGPGQYVETEKTQIVFLSVINGLFFIHVQQGNEMRVNLKNGISPIAQVLRRCCMC